MVQGQIQELNKVGGGGGVQQNFLQKKGGGVQQHSRDNLYSSQKEAPGPSPLDMPLDWW